MGRTLWNLREVIPTVLPFKGLTGSLYLERPPGIEPGIIALYDGRILGGYQTRQPFSEGENVVSEMRHEAIVSNNLSTTIHSV